MNGYLPSVKNSHLFVVADGHGSHGESVSQYIIDILPELLRKHLLKECKDFDNFDSNHQISLRHLQVKHAMIQSFREVNAEVNLKLNSMMSGSTLTVLIIINDMLYSANVGDSKAILIKHAEEQKELVQVTVDHKP